MALFDVFVDVSLRPGISDPQGQTVERALPALGFEGVQDVRIGKSIRFMIEAESEDAARTQVAAMAEDFLSNPVIEESLIVVQPAAMAESGSAS